MPMSIRSLLDSLSSSALDARDKGDRFERLIKAYLSNEPEWTARFENVWLWSEWPNRGNRTDIGIDIVAERRDGEGLAAIQCKFYAPEQKVSKAEIDKFIASSAGSKWTERYIFDTAAGWTGNAEETLEDVAQRIDIGVLDDARIDWTKYSWSAPDHVELATAHQPRRHQIAAINDPYPLEGLDTQPLNGDDPYEFYAVGEKKMKFGSASQAQKAAGLGSDRSTVQYNDAITVSGIPEEAYRYELGSRSAIEWLFDRYYIKTDNPSGIVNDANGWAREVGDPRYVFDLLARIVTLSLETMRIVDALPSLDIIAASSSED